MRLFVSVPVPVDLEAETAPAAVLPDFRPVPLGTWHLTLRFLGNVDPADAHAALDGLQVPAMDATFTVPGAFPKPAGANVLWMGVAARGLDALAADVRTRTEHLSSDRKGFVAHVTLGRFRRPFDARLLLRRIEPPRGSFALDRVQLMASELTPAGPSYTELAAWTSSDNSPTA